MATVTGYIGRRIGDIRRLRGISEEDFANSLHISVQDIGIIEQAKEIDLGRIKDIAVALGVTAEGLLGFNDERIQINTVNFYEDCGVNVNTVANNFQNTENSYYEEIHQSLRQILQKLETLVSKK
ncbi:helix-turn-helix transcriptional regulator [Chitinophaga pendula]|uniref:helix-turn-helix domain-containing protein n=1 Tax=Chitinophaga TaxID=79328 RepID=UPI000BAF76CB|nr:MULTISPECIES: helix-turn-helix transcriptional regulator [Chitinophaga]ASZ13734.1 transcriptional regulator [Chitinophaga sp. MD30]UCJ08648.1 helix-turn-helix transcriptional regulator [Chitinophaga pendula]